MKNVLIDITNVSKEIKKRQVLKDITLKIEEGKVYGVTGHNGSGKTMLFRLLLGLIKPTSGNISFNKELRFGAIIENPGFLLDKTGMKNLELLASIRNQISKERMKESMLLVGLDPDNKDNVKAYSLGMRQKLAIAQAIMEDPDVLVLDEPTNGLDKKSTLKIRELLKKINKEKRTTIIMTSHDAQDIDSLCKEVIELENGAITQDYHNQITTL
jgi:ABC-2 type transport system ATP-binding protein